MENAMALGDFTLRIAQRIRTALRTATAAMRGASATHRA